ncbi:hypothetical protein C8R43DRAFT_980963 [Mycena crocata]|nr:hypothetical protein C8R43DRAFT_980963 [Mycena crocata]
MASSVIRAAAIQSLLKPRSHPLDASRVRLTTSLGDQVGLTKTAIHKTTLEPLMISTVEHFHDMEDEWFFILAGSGTLLRAGEGDDTAVSAGDFVGFAAATRQPHAFRAGNEGMEYLTLGGSRVPEDVCHYPLIGKMLGIRREDGVESTVVSDEVSESTTRVE